MLKGRHGSKEVFGKVLHFFLFQKTESSKTPGKAVPPPSPVRASEDLSSEMPIWAHNSTLPQNLLKE